MVTKSIGVRRGAAVMPFALIALLLGSGHALAANPPEWGASAEEGTPIGVSEPTEWGAPLALSLGDLALPLQAQEEAGLLPGQGEIQIAGPVRRAVRRAERRHDRRESRRDRRDDRRERVDDRRDDRRERVDDRRDERRERWR
jgi:hypothetical protein